MDTDAAPRHEQLAAVFASKIGKGQFAPGARMPSVRSVGEQHGISSSTALQAYRLLQERGILVARPQAGFYVAAPSLPSAAPGAPAAPALHRYEQLADLIVGMIDSGTLAPGARMPSVRAISKEHGLSISTVLQAYRWLEERGVLVARPQSGFYVATTQGGTLALPSRPVFVGVSQ